ncbi:MAG TPA: FAD-linked oxidase C-terminal domain-containing protein [Planctomycetota bacterium]|nr:FAD-linked oxidase C-terminal domain-containing protein [Planctomycetota bacterium]
MDHPPSTPATAPAGDRDDRPATIGGFTVLGEIGRGGFGVVYQARQASLDRLVAIKVLAAHSGADDARSIARFSREARVAARLNHPHIVQAIDFGRDPATGRWYYAMELVEGPNLRVVVERSGQLGERQALRIAAAIASALKHAHAAGIVHRDIKPENIFLTRNGVPKLGDLGLARRVSADSSTHADRGVAGTPLYMAPEQILDQGDGVDGRADLYSLGATLYHAVTGAPPFTGDEPMAILSAHLNQEPTDPRELHPGLSQAFTDLILRLLAKDPARRPADAQALVTEIAELRRAKVVQARTARAGRPIRSGLATARPGGRRRSTAPAPTPTPATIEHPVVGAPPAVGDDRALEAALVAATSVEVVDARPAACARWAAVGAWRATPRAVALPRGADDVAAILAVAARQRVPVVFRGGGASDSGHAVGDGIVVVTRNLRRMRRDRDVDVVCGAGVAATLVDAALAGSGRRLGVEAGGSATVGGLIAGGIAGIDGLAFDLVLADGSRVDTGAADADAQLAARRPALARELMELRDAIRADTLLARRVAAAAELGNGLGYRLDAFLDGATPAAILQRLVGGSEGTLAFIAGARLRTVARADADAVAASAWLPVTGLAAAVLAAQALCGAGATTAEVVDGAALRLLGVTDGPADQARLLVEWRCADAAALEQRLASAATILDGVVDGPFAATTDPVARQRLRRLRARLPGAAGAAALVHDLVLPTDRLRDAAPRVRAALDRHGFADAALTVGGHDGSLRALVALDHGDPRMRERHRAAQEKIIAIVLGAGGCLSGDAGTGRGRAALVARQWGDDGVALMRRVKRAFDPDGILAPGVVLPDARAIALVAPSAVPPVSAAVDRCNGCGDCETGGAPPEDGLRQRIARLRRMHAGGAAERLAAAAECGADAIARRLRRHLAAGPCPAGIADADVAAVEFGAPPPRWRPRLAGLVQRNLAAVARLSAVAAGYALRLGDGRMPLIGVALPPPAIGCERTWTPGAATLVHLPSCIATASGSRVGDDLARLCAHAGVALRRLPVAGTCCGDAFAVVGCDDAAAAAGAGFAAAVSRLEHELPGGAIVVTDRGACAARARAAAGDQGIRIMGPALVAARLLLPGVATTSPDDEDAALAALAAAFGLPAGGVATTAAPHVWRLLSAAIADDRAASAPSAP